MALHRDHPEQTPATPSQRAARGLIARRLVGAERFGTVERRLAAASLNGNAHAFMAAVFPDGSGRWKVSDVLGWAASGSKGPPGMSWDGLVAYVTRGGA